MRFKRIVLVMITSLALLLPGCWDARELTDLSITTALGIDKQDGQYTVTAQILNPGEVAGETVTTRTAVSIYTMTGDTLFEAIRKLTTVSPRRLYLAHLRMVVFGEEIAREGVSDVLDFLSRDHDMRTDFYFAVARENTAENLLKVMTPLEQIPADKMAGMLETTERSWASVGSTSIDELIASMSSTGKEANITGIVISGDPDVGTNLDNVERIDSITMLEAKGMGIFQNDRLIGWMNEEQSQTVNILNSKVTNTVTWVPCGEDGKITAEVFEINPEITGTVEGDQPKIKVKVTEEADIADVACVINLRDPKKINELEKGFEESLQKKWKKSVDEIRGLGTDVFGFGEVIRRANLDYWKKVEDDWGEIFANELEVELEVEFQIKKTGTTNESFLKEINEKIKQEDQ
ncbi:Ger(x)C family spore germination protein [Virgibacillus xinjiangensis]|uniref:Ger(X)C family spore germination protein n=1 Tax=Virgibacillus xinjiangensis TaxID=393090 RepID=A0ABV7CW79_9BACI